MYYRLLFVNLDAENIIMLIRTLQLTCCTVVQFFVAETEEAVSGGQCGQITAAVDLTSGAA